MTNISNIIDNFRFSKFKRTQLHASSIFFFISLSSDSFCSTASAENSLKSVLVKLADEAKGSEPVVGSLNYE